MTQMTEVAALRARQLMGTLFNAEQLDDAECVARLLLDCEPDHAEASHTLALLASRRGQSLDARRQLEQLVARVPDSPTYLTNLGAMYLACGEVEKAVHTQQRAVDLSHGAIPSVLVNLARAYHGAGQLEQARLASRQAFDLSQDKPVMLSALGKLFGELGDADAQLDCLRRCYAVAPRDLMATENLIDALRAQRRVDELTELYRVRLAEDPKDLVARHLLSASSGENVPARADDDYLARIFDEYAPEYEDHLVENLAYQGHVLCAAALSRHATPPAAALDVIDLGCGTGLCGPLLAPWSRSLVGVDLSPGMLRRARTKKVYTRLVLGELTTVLAADDAQHDVATCSDTFSYFGELEAPFAAAHRALRPGGLFVFSVEALHDESGQEHRIDISGRYAHSQAYLQHTLVAAGFELLELREEKLRDENRLPVLAYVVVARKPQTAGR